MVGMTEAEASAMSSALFGAGTVGIPHAFLELLRKRVSRLHGVVASPDFAKDVFRAYWLDGQLFRGLIYQNTGNDCAPWVREFAYPLSALSGVKSEHRSLQYDPIERRHQRWLQVVTVEFGNEESIVIEIFDDDSGESRLVDALLSAVAKAGG
jgi:hypothetical protein